MTDRERRAKADAKMSEIMKSLRESETIDLESTPSRPWPASIVRDGQHVQTGSVSPHEIADLESKCRELEVKLQRTKLECRYIERQTQIETETRNLHSMTLHPAAATAPPDTRTLDAPPEFQGYLHTSNASKKARKIQDYVWTGARDLLDESKTIDMGNGVKLNVGEKKLSLGDVTIEQWGYASLQILFEMINDGTCTLKQSLDYVRYTQSVFRLAANYMWPSVLLYDREYRENQLKYSYTWNTPCAQLREFNLIPKRDNATTQFISHMGKAQVEKPVHQPTVIPSTTNKRGRGPFLPNGREICRRFNQDNCVRPDCRLAHNCYICYGTNHPATKHGLAGKTATDP